jgi:hypothetical protein
MFRLIETPSSGHIKEQMLLENYNLKKCVYGIAFTHAVPGVCKWDPLDAFLKVIVFQ